MIKRLDIKNYAIIESLSIEFSEGLNIITGETGSGKSILIGALGLILGKRADTKVLQDKNRKCIVEGIFDIHKFKLHSYFKRENLDYDPELIIRREISSFGKSRAFINDTPVNLTQLQNLTALLVDQHQQFENLGINDTSYQLQMLDALAGTLDKVKKFRNTYGTWKSLERRLADLTHQQAESHKQRDYILFQLEELQQSQIDIEEDGALETRLKAMEHSEEIIRKMGGVAFQLEESENAIISGMNALLIDIQNLTGYHQNIEKVYQRLQEVTIDLEDIASEMKQIAEDTHYDEDTIHEMRERLDQLNHLFYKHQVNSVEELYGIYEQLQREALAFENIESEIIAVQKESETFHLQLDHMAQQLHNQRKKVLPDFVKQVNLLLKALKMEHASFNIRLDQSGAFHSNGYDDVAFLFAPNKGSEFRPVKEVASGGELARISLITKSLVAASLAMPTLIFDEIDSGVSGDVAQKMGEIIRAMARKHQIISITHSPQVAAKANTHFKVFKKAEDKMTKTYINQLNREDRIVEIATMLSSSPPSKVALANAEELLSQ